MLLILASFDSGGNTAFMFSPLTVEGIAEFGFSVGDGLDPGLITVHPDIGRNRAMACYEAERDDQIQGCPGGKCRSDPLEQRPPKRANGGKHLSGPSR
jgi:hypothetical protein